MRLFHFRLSLKEQRISLFRRMKADSTDFTREEWLRERFSNHFEFTHRQTTFFFVPETNVTGIPEELIVGWIARKREINERTPPWEGLGVTEHHSWQAALIVIDPSHHEDGQKIAMESRSEVGAAEAILASLANSLGADIDEPFSVAVYPIIEERSFARFAEEHKNTIRQITYEAAVPNMFGGADDFSNEMRLLRETANVSKVKTRLESDEVIDIDNSKLKEIAKYVEKGGGKISARTTDGARYNSAEHAAYTDVPNTDEPTQASFWENIKRAVERIF
ncbi:hypothetical protein O9X94_15055 [Agrobacterium leguminum]|uniref:Uncharacterized protein n=1 Tax=Agrobacterium leguminum TaxID=2792015 RepID=A0A9X3QT68_9HYPH|nr:MULTISPECIES: hypothetical protein [Agrobacterium]MCZ7910642.1 hypothetical protein [Agrobacterium leguminum]TQN61839.1 hypothetical protein FLX27_09185 [Agrobacterium tumefaciens]